MNHLAPAHAFTPYRIVCARKRAHYQALNLRSQRLATGIVSSLLFALAAAIVLQANAT